MVTMTDKQIIIDGIDVGGCIYYEDGKCLNGEMVQCNCKKVAVCYYKEYKRKEQECEELKEQLKEMNEVIRTETTRCSLVNSLKTELDQLKAENDELKEEKQGLIKDWEEKKNLAYEIACKNDKAKTALTEIKEIAEDFYLNGEHVKDKYLAQEILQKISEYEVE